jgi:hypothetical protein
VYKHDGKVETNPCIIKCFDASTAHITRHDDDLLKISDEQRWYPIVYPYEFGYFVYVHMADPIEEFDECNEYFLKVGFSEAFVGLLKKARVLECKYLQLDADGTIYEDLPTFEW